MKLRRWGDRFLKVKIKDETLNDETLEIIIYMCDFESNVCHIH